MAAAPASAGTPENRNRAVLGNAETGIRAVLFDFGGVLSTSPFEAFARYEGEEGLPAGFLRMLNATNQHDNAWARLERGEVSLESFAALFGEGRGLTDRLRCQRDEEAAAVNANLRPRRRSRSRRRWRRFMP